MSITLITDMLYTRSGEATESNVLSVHNPLIWEFSDNAIAANPTATIQFVVTDKDAVEIYSSNIFSCYLVVYLGTTAAFRFDATQIIKHIINNYFYKETSELVEPENYGSKVEVTIKTYDNAVLEDTEVTSYFASHALNQIGDEYGTNIPRLFYNDIEDIAHFLGFPNHLFFYAPLTLAAEDPVLEIYDGSETTELITAWTNLASSFDTLETTGAEIDSAIDNGATAAIAQSNTFTEVVVGDYFIFTGTLTQTSGTRPSVRIFDSGGTGAISIAVQLAVGANTIVLKVIDAAVDLTAYCHIFLDPGAATNFSIADVSFIKVANMSVQDGTLGLYLHDWNLGHMLMDKTIVRAKALYDEDDRNVIKTYNIIVFQPCKNAVYIRFLTKDGYYMYWAFSPYPITTKSSDKLGSVINSFSEMALAQSRNFPIGYRNSFNKMNVIASVVPIVFRYKLMDLFTSPAVYLWQGRETLNENLNGSIVNFTGNPYETLITSRTIIISAINTVDYGYLSLKPAFDIKKGDVIIVILNFNLNSGTAPYIRMIAGETGSIISNVPQLTHGLNTIELTSTGDSNECTIFIYNTTVVNFSTSEIIVKRKEKESDWILLDRIEGSHILREKMKHDNFECTLVLPENYTQTLSGQNL